MTQDNRSGRPQGRPPEGEARLSRVEASLRGPFLLFFVSAVVWLLAASLLAVVASLGVAIGGAFGGGGKAAAPTNTGTGTVFGDADAQSKSISNALERQGPRNVFEIPPRA